jgi:hypothetical protein
MNRLVLLSFLAAACSEYNVGQKPADATSPLTTATTPPDTCAALDEPAAPADIGDPCSPPGGFEPIIEWSYGANKSSRATVGVADLDGDGMPEIVANITGLLPQSSGDLVAVHGDGTEMWTVHDTLGYGSSPAIGDLDGDGSPEIVEVREYKNSTFGPGDYTGVAFDANGNQIWESEHFVGLDFDYATAPAISDMDHDGSPEVVLGRVILHADGTTRGVGEYGRGSYGILTLGGLTISEASVPAVTDLDLDGTEEVVVGDSVYSPDGVALWHDDSRDDGMIAIANLDSDPKGEFVASTHNTVRAMDTDGSVLWGPTVIPNANIVSPAAIGDLDGDGSPEIVVAGGNNLVAIHADGTQMWTAQVHDESGASGASLFDFEGDGIPEVVYIDEIEMVAFDGLTGAVKFWTDKHASDTMMDYPVIADVDADGHAEIVVTHANWGYAFSVYGDKTNSWAPARAVWNQHAYSITNIDDDLSVPTTAVINFTTLNSWHSAITGEGGDGFVNDLAAEILDTCSLDCDDGIATVWGRLVNHSDSEAPMGIPMALYAYVGGAKVLIDVETTPAPVPPGSTSEAIRFTAPASSADHADKIELVADDDGNGGSQFGECDEDNNADSRDGAVCD